MFEKYTSNKIFSCKDKKKYGGEVPTHLWLLYFFKLQNYLEQVSEFLIQKFLNLNFSNKNLKT